MRNELGLLGHHTQIYSEDYVEVYNFLCTENVSCRAGGFLPQG